MNTMNIINIRIPTRSDLEKMTSTERVKLHLDFQIAGCCFVGECEDEIIRVVPWRVIKTGEQFKYIENDRKI